MAKRNGKPFSVVCAFWGLVIASAVFVTSGIFHAFGILTSVVNILNLVGKIALFLAVAICSFQFVKGKQAGWKVVYWVSHIVYEVGEVFGIVKFV